MKQGAQWFSYLKQLLKLYTRQRDKAMMLSMIEEVSLVLAPTVELSRVLKYPLFTVLIIILAPVTNTLI